MLRYWNYLKTVIHHKWEVYHACRQLGVAIPQAVLHDRDKLAWSSFMAYAHQFYNTDGTKRQVRDATGAYDPNAQSSEFRHAWLIHQRNKHHWQAWCSIGDGGSLSPLSMPERYVREMVADWIGAGRVYGNEDPHGWYEKNKKNMVLHPETVEMIDRVLATIDRKAA